MYSVGVILYTQYQIYTLDDPFVREKNLRFSNVVTFNSWFS